MVTIENMDSVPTVTEGGGELTIAAMNEYQYAMIGRATYQFVKRCFADPEKRKLIEKTKAELEASGYFERMRELYPSAEPEAELSPCGG